MFSILDWEEGVATTDSTVSLDLEISEECLKIMKFLQFLQTINIEILENVDDKKMQMWK